MGKAIRKGRGMSRPTFQRAQRAWVLASRLYGNPATIGLAALVDQVGSLYWRWSMESKKEDEQ